MKELFLDILAQPFGIVIYQLLDATQFTIYLSLIAFAGGGVIGLAVTAARVAPSTLGRNLASGYIWLFQSVPLLMLLFLFGLGLPKLLAINIDPWLAATGALTSPRYGAAPSRPCRKGSGKAATRSACASCRSPA